METKNRLQRQRNAKIMIISPGLIFFQKALRWAYFSRGLLSEGILLIKIGLPGLSLKAAKNTKITA